MRAQTYWNRFNIVVNQRIGERTTKNIPSLSLNYEPREAVNSLAGMDFDERETYLKREAAAQVIIEARKLQVAPAYNKGGLQLITNPEDFKTMGRKI